MSQAPHIRLRGVRKRYGSGFSLVIDDLFVVRGETLALVGPTGAGKSTLLKLITGLEPLDGGEIGIGADATAVGRQSLADRRRMTMVFQRPLLLNGSVRWNVEHGLRLRGAVDAAKVDGWLQRLGLSRLAAQSSRTLSGGQIQLAALARALAVEPEILLADEPTANLDPASVALVEETLAEARRQRGMTIVWATHHLFQARRTADRVALLWDGRLIEAAATEQFFESPSDSRTRDFVGGKIAY